MTSQTVKKNSPILVHTGSPSGACRPASCYIKCYMQYIFSGYSVLYTLIRKAGHHKVQIKKKVKMLSLLEQQVINKFVYEIIVQRFHALGH